MGKIRIRSKGIVYRNGNIRLGKNGTISIDEDKVDKNLKQLIDAGKVEVLGGKRPEDIEVNKDEEKRKASGKAFTLDDKDSINFLNQNTRTVVKQINENDLTVNDCFKLQKRETTKKKRRLILDALKKKIKVLKDGSKS